MISSRSIRPAPQSLQAERSEYESEQEQSEPQWPRVAPPQTNNETNQDERNRPGD
jgi:hypothetical protein